MSDFVLQFGRETPREPIAERLRGRPHLSEREIRIEEFPWGAAILQAPPDPRYRPHAAADTLTVAAGRPVFLEGPALANRDASFAERLAREWMEVTATSSPRRLSGMYALARIGQDRLELVTDPMGLRPLYVGLDRAGNMRSLGTFAEAVAIGAGREADFDPISLAELLLRRRITFPHTSREGVHELEPGSIHRLRADAGGRFHCETQATWRPLEPTRWDPEPQLEDELEAALRRAADDVTRDADRVAVTLSGGRDSRAVLALIPPSRRTGAITFVTHENRETRVARAVAEAAATPHFFARRDPEYFASLLERGVRLLGTDLPADPHGCCISDSGLERRFDVIVGGQLCDSYLKGRFLPPARRRRAGSLVRRAAGAGRAALGVLRGRARDARREPVDLRPMLRPAILEAVEQRRLTRLHSLQAIRPDSAEEWMELWPSSRRHGPAHIQGNSRLFSADGLFLHAGVIEVASRLPPAARLDGALARRVFARICGPLWEIPSADELARRPGAAAGASADPVAEAPGAAPEPWNRVENSWVSWRSLQQHSPRWQGYRDRLARADGLEILDGILAFDARDAIREYRPDLGSGGNRMLMQLALAIDLASSAR